MLSGINRLAHDSRVRREYLEQWARFLPASTLLEAYSNAMDGIKMALQTIQSAPRQRPATAGSDAAESAPVRPVPVFLRLEHGGSLAEQSANADPQDGGTDLEETTRFLAAAPTELPRLAWLSERLVQQQLSKFMKPLLVKGMEPKDLQGAPSPEAVAAGIGELVHEAAGGMARFGALLG